MNTINPYTITNETFDSLLSLWRDSRSSLTWNCLFVSPMWLMTWWEVFGNGHVSRLYGIRNEGDIIGIAPLLVKGDTAQFMGNGDVCDYLDFIITPGQEAQFFRILLPFLRDQGIARLNLTPIHRNSTVCAVLSKIDKELKYSIEFDQEDVLFELKLPDTWEEYLKSLPGKYRHEIRRKLRRLEKAGDIRYYEVDNSQHIESAMNAFLALFRSSRSDKSDFMTDQMVSFFKLLAASFAQFDMLKLIFLELNGTPVAAVMCFDYRSTVYLYNNGYDNRFAWLSVGLISKLYSIKDSIEEGKNTYDFLKGDEDYKKRLGGEEIPVYDCRIRL